MVGLAPTLEEWKAWFAKERSPEMNVDCWRAPLVDRGKDAPIYGGLAEQGSPEEWHHQGPMPAACPVKFPPTALNTLWRCRVGSREQSATGWVKKRNNGSMIFLNKQNGSSWNEDHEKAKPPWKQRVPLERNSNPISTIWRPQPPNAMNCSAEKHLICGSRT